MEKRIAPASAPAPKRRPRPARRIVVGVRLTEDIKNAAETAAEQEGWSLSMWIAWAVNKELKARGAPKNEKA